MGLGVDITGVIINILHTMIVVWKRIKYSPFSVIHHCLLSIIVCHFPLYVIHQFPSFTIVCYSPLCHCQMSYSPLCNCPLSVIHHCVIAHCLLFTIVSLPIVCYSSLCHCSLTVILHLLSFTNIHHSPLSAIIQYQLFPISGIHVHPQCMSFPIVCHSPLSHHPLYGIPHCLSLLLLVISNCPLSFPLIISVLKVWTVWEMMEKKYIYVHLC